MLCLWCTLLPYVVKFWNSTFASSWGKRLSVIFRLLYLCALRNKLYSSSLPQIPHASIYIQFSMVPLRAYRLLYASCICWSLKASKTLLELQVISSKHGLRPNTLNMKVIIWSFIDTKHFIVSRCETRVKFLPLGYEMKSWVFGVRSRIILASRILYRQSLCARKFLAGFSIYVNEEPQKCFAKQQSRK